MACNSRLPGCAAAPEAVPEPITQFGTIIAIISAIIGVLGIAGQVTVVNGVLYIAGVALGAAGGAAVTAALVGIAAIVFVGLYVSDRCIQGEGIRNCIAGVVHEIVGSFSEATEEILPFTAMHDRVDVVVKQKYWDIVESSGAYVFCTGEVAPRRSEIMRVYYYDARVCGAAKGALYGTVAGAVAGVIIAAVVIAAIGCATVILCIFALLLAALIAAVACIVGAFVGGQIGKAAASTTDPTDDATGTTLRTGDLISVTGNTQQREHDDGANVIWWESSTSLHGHVADGTPQPFSYCEIDDQLANDACPRPPTNNGGGNPGSTGGGGEIK